MEKNKDKIVLYFGTTGSAGHHLHVLCGYVNKHIQTIIENDLDGDECLYAEIVNGKGIRYLYYRGITMLCVPYSLHDDRGGCKSMFIVKGYLSKDEIQSELAKYPYYNNIFNKLSELYKLDGIYEIESLTL